MTISYVVAERTPGANPFAIFEGLASLDEHCLGRLLRGLSYKVFVNTAYWFAVSMTAKARAGNRCQICNSPNSIQTHHRTYETHGHEHLNMADLVVLCGNCHGVFHGHKTTPPQPTKPIKMSKIPKMNGIPVSLDAVVARDQATTLNLSRIMPSGDSFPLTRQLVDQCRTNGSFTNATLVALPLEIPLKRGWTTRLVGQHISREAYEMALNGRYVYA